MAAKKKLSKDLDNGFSDVTVADQQRHSDDADKRFEAEQVHAKEMARRRTASTEGGGAFPPQLLYQRLQPKTRWPK